MTKTEYQKLLAFKENQKNVHPSVPGFGTAGMFMYLYDQREDINVFSGDKLAEARRKLPVDGVEAARHRNPPKLWSMPGVCGG